MTYLTAAVVLEGALLLLSLVLIMGVIRRLREHTEKLAAMAGATAAPTPMKSAGEQAGDFTTTATDGLPVSRELLTGQTLVGFFTPHCPPCLEMAQAFIEQAAALPGGRDRALAVVIGEGADATSFSSGFADVARVVVESDAPDFGPLATAFSATAFPVCCLVDERGVILATGYSPAELPTPVAP